MKAFGKVRIFRSIALAMVALLFMQQTVGAYADNDLVSQTELTFVENNQDADFSGLSINDFIWPDVEGHYSVTLSEGIVPGNEYMIFVVKGCYTSLENLSNDELVRNIVYINQKKADSTTLSFVDFAPSRNENSTVIVSGEGMSPRVVGYIAKDLFTVSRYSNDEQGYSRITDSYYVEKGAEESAVLELLPKTGYAVITSPYTSKYIIKVSFDWAVNETFSSEEIGKNYTYIAKTTIDDASVASGVSSILRPFAVNVTIADRESNVTRISVTKDKVLYRVGETVLDNDIHVSAFYDDGTIRNEVSYAADLTSVDTAVTGTQYITVVSCGLTARIKITIADESSVGPGEENAYHQVSFDTRGGSYVASVVVTDKLTELPENPEKSGFVFIGWFINEECTEKFDKELTITSDITLYAGWRNSLLSTPESIEVALDSQTFSLGTYLTEDMITVFVNYSDGFVDEVDDFTTNLESIDQTTTGNKYVVASCDIDGKHFEEDAVFRIVSEDLVNMYRVSFDTNSEEEIEDQMVLEGDKVVEPSAPNKEGYSFVGWYNGQTKYDFSKAVTSNMTLTAKWVIENLIDVSGNFYVYTEDTAVYEYTGSAITPTPLVVDASFNVLKKNTDYKITYKNNKSASVNGVYAHWDITGKGNYQGTLGKDFVIRPRDLGGDSITLTCPSFYGYNANGIKPSPTVKYGKTTLKENRDYTVTFERISEESSENGVPAVKPITVSGWYKMTVSGMGNFEGTKTHKFKLATSGMVDLKNTKVTVAKQGKSVNYTGRPINIDDYITLKYKTYTLVPDIDYVVEYADDCTNPGTVKVVIKAVEESDNFYGVQSTSFKITGLAIKNATIALKASSVNYDGFIKDDNLSYVQMKVTKSNKAAIEKLTGYTYELNSYYRLVENKDYTVKYSKALKSGTASVNITGKGLFTGTIKKTFKINPISLKSNSEIQIQVEDAIQSRNGAIPKVTITFTSGSTVYELVQGTDYTIKASSNTDAGTKAKVTISGKGNFKDSVARNYTIKAKSLRDLGVVISSTDVLVSNPKAGQIYKPAITVTDNGKALKLKKDYTIDYSGCLGYDDYLAGKTEGYVVVNALSKSYTGGVRVYYNISDINIANAVINISDQIYTGSPIVFDLESEEDLAKFTDCYIEVNGAKVNLRPGVDFDITAYKSNKSVGNATVTIVGKGKYAGTKKITVKIVKYRIN